MMHDLYNILISSTLRYIKHTSTIKMTRHSSYQYAYSLMSKRGLYSSFPACFLLISSPSSSSSPLLQNGVAGFTTHLQNMLWI